MKPVLSAERIHIDDTNNLAAADEGDAHDRLNAQGLKSVYDIIILCRFQVRNDKGHFANDDSPDHIFAEALGWIIV